jgi:hypothetical protein
MVVGRASAPLPGEADPAVWYDDSTSIRCGVPGEFDGREAPNPAPAIT